MQPIDILKAIIDKLGIKNHKISIKENIRFKKEWNIIVTTCDCTSKKAIEMANKIKNGAYELLEEYHHLFSIDQQLIKNIVPDVALQAIADNFVYSSSLLPATSELEASYIGVGDDNTAVAAGDTELTNEVYRESASTSVRNGKIAQITQFLSNSEANGYTLQEIGCFGGDAKVFGDSTSQFDITDEGGNTFRYTWDSNGTDPNFDANGLAVSDVVVINSSTFNSANNGLQTITAVTDDYFEVTNASGVAESNKILSTNTSIARIGTILNHALISPTIAKTSAKTVTAQINFTVADA